MKIYTKTGDKGDTSLFGGHRVPKSSLRIDAYGTVDELNSLLGTVRALRPNPEIDVVIEQLQSRLFVLGADLASPADVASPKLRRILPDDVRNLEEIIDRVEAQLEPLSSFILPGGSQAAAQLHVARAVCRRAERLVDALARREETGSLPLVFLNRLNDLLFVLARYANKLDGERETRWEASGA